MSRGMQRTLRLLFVATLVGSVLAASLGAIPRAWAADAAEPAIATPGPVGDYLRRAHGKVHARWAEGYLKQAKPPTADSAARQATVALTIRWDGSIAEANMRAFSGSPGFAHAAVALAETGDRVQGARLKGALGSRATVKLAAKSLQRLGVDICESVGDALMGTAAMARANAFAAVRVAAAAGANIRGCRPSLETLAKDGKQPQAVRLSAFEILTANFPGDVRPLVLGLMSDKDPGVRGAATFASVKKGGGRPEMYRLAPLLHDKAVEVRGAASAGIVRAAGDLALEQLYLLARETDPRPARAVAAELGAMSSAPSAEFLGHMVKRDNREVQLAAARALAGRTDAAARAELDSVKTSSTAFPELLALANGSAPAAGPVAGPTDQAEIALQDLMAHHKDQAVGWIVARFPEWAPQEAIDVLGAWLERQTMPAAAQAPAPAPAATGPSAAL